MQLHSTVLLFRIRKVFNVFHTFLLLVVRRSVTQMLMGNENVEEGKKRGENINLINQNKTRHFVTSRLAEYFLFISFFSFLSFFLCCNFQLKIQFLMSSRNLFRMRAPRLDGRAAEVARHQDKGNGRFYSILYHHGTKMKNCISFNCILFSVAFAKEIE